MESCLDSFTTLLKKKRMCIIMLWGYVTTSWSTVIIKCFDVIFLQSFVFNQITIPASFSCWFQNVIFSILLTSRPSKLQSCHQNFSCLLDPKKTLSDWCGVPFSTNFPRKLNLWHLLLDYKKQILTCCIKLGKYNHIITYNEDIIVTYR